MRERERERERERARGREGERDSFEQAKRRIVISKLRDASYLWYFQSSTASSLQLLHANDLHVLALSISYMSMPSLNALCTRSRSTTSCTSSPTYLVSLITANSSLSNYRVYVLSQTHFTNFLIKGEYTSCVRHRFLRV